MQWYSMGIAQLVEWLMIQIQFLVGTGIFFFTTTSRAAQDSTKPHILWVLWG